MDSPLLTVTFGCLLLGVVAAVFMIGQHMRKERELREFMQNAMNPVKLKESVDAAQRWSGEMLAKAARRYLFDRPSPSTEWINEKTLMALGAPAHAAVLDVLRDKGLHRRLAAPDKKHWYCAESPLKRACDLLGDEPPVEAVSLLAPFLRSPERRAREAAALTIAETGHASIVPLIRQVLADSKEVTRVFALIGLERALNRSGVEPGTKAELYPSVLSLFEAGAELDYGTLEHGTKVLLGLDTEEATRFFLSPEVFRADSPILHRALEAMREARVSVPRERLRSLISSLEASEPGYCRKYGMAKALRLLGRHRHPDDKALIERWTSANEATIATGASDALASWHGLEDWERRLWDSLDQKGWEALPLLQRQYLAARYCDSEVRNGGFHQYFSNPWGGHWREAVEGFRMIGASERASILLEATAHFGRMGPSSDREARDEELLQVTGDNLDFFQDLDARYYDSREVFDALGSLFVIANAESFQ